MREKKCYLHFEQISDSFIAGILQHKQKKTTKNKNPKNKNKTKQIDLPTPQKLAERATQTFSWPKIVAASNWTQFLVNIIFSNCYLYGR